jgi:hypothetical protein
LALFFLYSLINSSVDAISRSSPSRFIMKFWAE